VVDRLTMDDMVLALRLRVLLSDLLSLFVLGEERERHCFISHSSDTRYLHKIYFSFIYTR
jgi:hypothetical protein